MAKCFNSIGSGPDARMCDFALVQKTYYDFRDIWKSPVVGGIRSMIRYIRNVFPFPHTVPCEPSVSTCCQVVGESNATKSPSSSPTFLPLQCRMECTLILARFFRLSMVINRNQAAGSRMTEDAVNMSVIGHS